MPLWDGGSMLHSSRSAPDGEYVLRAATDQARRRGSRLTDTSLSDAVTAVVVVVVVVIAAAAAAAAAIPPSCPKSVRFTRPG